MSVVGEFSDKLYLLQQPKLLDEQHNHSGELYAARGAGAYDLEACYGSLANRIISMTEGGIAVLEKML